jgi:hypothetical protein
MDSARVRQFLFFHNGNGAGKKRGIRNENIFSLTLVHGVAQVDLGENLTRAATEIPSSRRKGR